jgi:hypothetical protein
MTVDELLQILTVQDVGYDAHVDKAFSLIPGGLCCEFGVQDGRTLIPFAEKLAPRTIYGFDSFEGLPEDWCSMAPKGAFKADPFSQNWPSNVELVFGLYQQTLQPFLATTDRPVAFAHIDSDLYSSTKYVLDCLTGHLAKGAILIFDDIIGDNVYHDHVARAVAEWLTETNYEFKVIGMRHRSAAIFQINQPG